MTKEELMKIMEYKSKFLKNSDIRRAVNLIIDQIVSSLGKGEPLEVRGLGRFSVRKHRPRQARNPTTGVTWKTKVKHRVYFKPSKKLIFYK